MAAQRGSPEPIVKPMRPLGPLTQGLIDMIEHTGLHNAVMVEIGSYAGDSMRLFARSGRFRIIYCIDHWRTHASIAEPTFDNHRKPYAQRYSVPRVTKVKETSAEAARKFPPNSLDLIYIDASHDYPSVRDDITTWLPKLRPGGFMTGHDYKPSYPGVQHAVTDYLGIPHRVFQDSSWLTQVIASPEGRDQ
jgi:predicted O-methyltransferase YrrM